MLVKPQFEAGRAEVGKGGVVRDPEVHARVRDVAEAALAWGAQTLGVVDSGLPGRRGTGSSSSTSSTAKFRRCQMSSMTGSRQPRAEPVRTAAVVTHGQPETIGEALAQLERVAARRRRARSLRRGGREARARTPDASPDADITVVMGGDGTMLRALQGRCGRAARVGVNFGTVGFLTSIPPTSSRKAWRASFAGDYVMAELPHARGGAGRETHVAVNDVVVASSIVGRMIELAWAVGGEDLGELACDGVLCTTPSGSTAYNLSNGGPVLVWGLEAMAVTFIAPHSLQARTLVVPRGRDVAIENRTTRRGGADARRRSRVGELPAGEQVVVRVGEQRSLLAHLPEATFFRRYRETFAS